MKCPECGGPWVEDHRGYVHLAGCPFGRYEAMPFPPQALGGPATGWICPRCSRGVSPWVQVCPLCMVTQPEPVSEAEDAQRR